MDQEEKSLMAIDMSLGHELSLGRFHITGQEEAVMADYRRTDFSETGEYVSRRRRLF